MRRVFVYPDPQGVADAAGARLGLAIADAVALRGVAHVVLTGGTVGIELLRSLASSPLAALIDWTSVNVWWGDERFVAAGDADRNEGQAQSALLASVPLPEDSIHRMGSADAYENAEGAAAAYAADIAAHGPVDGWDIALFGMGPDGHVASLFPGHPVFEEQVAVAGGPTAVAVNDSPKPPPTRVSLSLASIRSARRAWVVAAGAPKADVVARSLAGDTSLPAAHVRGTEETLWLIDAEASTRI